MFYQYADAGPGPSSSKKPKLDRLRACDACRRRKQRCDGPQTADQVCTSCRQTNRRCTYVEASKPRGPPKAYVNGLEDRVERMEQLLRRLRPDIDLNAEIGPPVPRDSWKHPNQAHSHTSPASQASPTSTLDSLRKVPSLSVIKAEEGGSVDLSGGKDEDPYEAELDRTVDAFEKRLQLTEIAPDKKGNKLLDRQYRYHGSSAPIMLASVAAEHRDYELHEQGNSPGSRAGGVDSRFVWESVQREEFAHAPDWELTYEGLHITSPKEFPDLQTHWPPPDMAESLINAYFHHFNSMFPLLHRPTFEKHYNERLYEQNVWFACVCMGVFAIASKHSDDPRVLAAPDTPASTPSSSASQSEDDFDTTWHSAGVKYYYAVMTVLQRKQSQLTPSSLFEVQAVCLSTHFQRSTRWAGGAWVMYAASIRKVQDVGAHRKRSYKDGVTVENELWKRAYWYLVGFDRTGSAALGRPCSTRYEDADAELPLPVDDEYWKADFRQPSGGPLPQVTAFILWLRLTEITSFVLMHYYVAVDSPERHAARPADELLKQLNIAMTEWIEAVPDHLKWSPDIPDPVVANQSATLFLNYNMLTILIQRAFLPPTATRLRGLASPINPNVRGYPQASTALAIAVSAACAGARVLETAHSRGLSNMPIFLHAAEVFGAMLCLDVWILKMRERSRGEPALDAMHTIEQRMHEIQTIIRGVESARMRWEIAGPTLAYLRAAMPSPEDEGGWAGFSLEVMPDHEEAEHEEEGQGEFQLRHGAGAGASGAAQPFFLEHDAVQSLASATASTVPAAPAFPYSPMYEVPGNSLQDQTQGPFVQYLPTQPPFELFSQPGPGYQTLQSRRGSLQRSSLSPPQTSPQVQNRLTPVKLEESADFATGSAYSLSMPPPSGAPPLAGWQPWPLVPSPYAQPLPALRTRYSWDATQQLANQQDLQTPQQQQSRNSFYGP
ncbi:unnamed protein product [Peniophora sp. CBMAI 1063]|nr:unnamed protein product [Peniophora sp. CBMAI 1063]